MEEGLLFQRIVYDLEQIYHLFCHLIHNEANNGVTVVVSNEYIFIHIMAMLIIIYLIGISIAATIAIIKIPKKLDKLTKVLEKCIEEDDGE